MLEPPVDPVTDTVLPAPTIDTLLLLLVHTPPAEVSLSGTVTPWHMELAPCTGLGNTFTVSTVVVTQLLVV